MAGFSTDWLALREPCDMAARAASWPVFAAPCERLRQHASGQAQAPLHVIDLASGTGANLRALAPRLGGRQHWQLLDNDPALLAELPHAMARWALQRGYRCSTGARPDDVLTIAGPSLHVDIAVRCLDLARDADAIAFGRAHLVTACAWLDLVSAQWVDAMLDRVRGSGAAWLWALTVDGRIGWDPQDVDDATVHRWFGRHQLRDKGFGQALGPAAVPYLRERAAAAGDMVLQARSDWVIDGASRDTGALALLVAMIAGMADAAIEQMPHSTGVVRAWQARRMALARRTRLMVGHMDMACLP